MSVRINIFSMPAFLGRFTDLLNIPFVKFSDQTLMFFNRNHSDARHEYVLSCVDTFVIVSYTNRGHNRSHANDFDGSHGPTLK